MKCLFVCNEMSGRQKSKTFAEEIVTKLKVKYQEIRIFFTTGKKDDTIAQAENACGNCDIIVVCGGDGTFSDVLQGVAGKPNRPVLGYIPAGSCNDYAKSNHIPSKVDKAIDVILHGIKATKSALCTGKTYASYVLSGGLFTNLSYTTQSKKKKKFGKFAYYFDAIFSPKENKSIALSTTTNGNTVMGQYSLFGFLHSTHVSGFKVKSELKNDNKVDCLLIKAHKKKSLNVLSTMACLAKVVLVGMDKIKNGKYITHISTEKVQVNTIDEFIWNVDGEQGPMGDLEITLLPNQYEVMVQK